jgi:hypothetical protein
MTDVQRVSRPGSPFSGRDRAIALVVTIGILAAIAKPWGNGLDGSPATPAQSARAEPTPSPVPLPGHAFDPKLFGPFEPSPDWSIWPAGYFVSVEFVSREAIDRPPSLPASGPSQAAESPLAASHGPDSSPAVIGPDWPAEIVVGPGDHLVWLGVDTPLGWTISDTVLRRIESDGSLTDVPISRLPSEWDDHFAVLGIPVDASSERLADWAPGTYRLDITVDPGRLTRTIRVSILTAPDASSVPSPTTLP